MACQVTTSNCPCHPFTITFSLNGHRQIKPYTVVYMGDRLLKDFKLGTSISTLPPTSPSTEPLAPADTSYFRMTRYPTAALFLCLLVLVGATVDEPSEWPGLGDLPICVQNTFQNCFFGCSGPCIPCDVGCTDWTCACNQFPAAVSAASSVVVSASGCSSVQTNIASATSIMNAFCLQLTATPSAIEPGPTGPIPAPTGASGSGGDATTGME